MLDTAYRVEIPGGIELEAQIAGPVPRFLAFGLDLLIRSVLMLVLSMALIPFGEAGGGFILIAFFVIEWFYPVIFEVFRKGQTPGKKALGISVVLDDLTPVTFGSSVIRNLLRVADFLPMMYLTGLITMVMNQRFQRLGDMAAGTLVISTRETARAAAPDDITPLAPSVQLSRNEQTAIINFLQRSPKLSDARKNELATILDEVTHPAGNDRVTILHRLGAWFLGVR